jgi:hypothetical protein
MIGDCWLISAMAALTAREKAFKQVFSSLEDNKAGVFAVKFWRAGKTVEVTYPLESSIVVEHVQAYLYYVV